MIPYLVIVVLLACIIILSIKFLRLRKSVNRLSDSIQAFIKDGKTIEFSTRDDSFAVLNNSISDLTQLYSLNCASIEKKSKQSTQFISDISHQLKTPLAGIRLYVEMEHSANPSEHTQRELLLIEKMESLIFRLIHLEKIKTDCYTMDMQTASMRELVAELINEFKALFPNKQYILKGDSLLRMDKAWIAEALSNIIKNASEHTRDDGRVEIIIENADSSTCLTIKDDGGGVPEEDLKKLFHRFHRTENAKADSVGIGLAITKAIIEKHHGTIAAENGKDGLILQICLPHLDGHIAVCE